jgi:hypothetical protein
MDLMIGEPSDPGRVGGALKYGSLVSRTGRRSRHQQKIKHVWLSKCLMISSQPARPIVSRERWKCTFFLQVFETVLLRRALLPRVF